MKYFCLFLGFVLTCYKAAEATDCPKFMEDMCKSMCNQQGCAPKCGGGSCQCVDCGGRHGSCSSTHLATCHEHCKSKDCSRPICSPTDSGGFHCVCNGCTDAILGTCDNEGDAYCERACKSKSCTGGKCTDQSIPISGAPASSGYRCGCTGCEIAKPPEQKEDKCSSSDISRCESNCKSKSCTSNRCTKPNGVYQCSCSSCSVVDDPIKQMCAQCQTRCTNQQCAKSECSQVGSNVQCKCTDCGPTIPPPTGAECEQKDKDRCEDTCEQKNCPKSICAITNGWYQCQCVDCGPPPTAKTTKKPTTKKTTTRKPTTRKPSSSSSTCDSADLKKCKSECDGVKCSGNSCTKPSGRYRCSCSSCSTSTQEKPTGCTDSRKAQCNKWCGNREKKTCSNAKCIELDGGKYTCNCDGC